MAAEIDSLAKSFEHLTATVDKLVAVVNEKLNTEPQQISDLATKLETKAEELDKFIDAVEPSPVQDSPVQ